MAEEVVCAEGERVQEVEVALQYMIGISLV